MRYINRLSIKNYPLKGNLILTSTFILFTGQMVSNFVGYIYNVFLGKILDPDRFGTDAYGNFWSLTSISYYFLVPVTALVLVFTKQTANRYAKGEMDKIHAFYQKYLTTLTKIVIFSSVISVILAVPMKEFLHIEKYDPIIINNLSITLALFYPLTVGILGGLQKFVAQSTIYFSAAMIRLVLGILLAATFGVTGAISGNLILTVATILIGFYFTQNFLKRTKTSQQKSIEINLDWKLFFSTMISTFALGAFLTSDVVLIKHYLSGQFLDGSQVDIPSLYAMLSLFGRIIFFFSLAFANVVLPISAYTKTKGGSHLKVLRTTILLATASIIPVLGIYFVVPEFVINATFTSNYLVASRYLGPYALSVSLYAIQSILVNYFISIDKKSFAVIPTFFAILQVILHVIWHNSIENFIGVLYIVNGLSLISLLIYLAIIIKKDKSQKSQ